MLKTRLFIIVALLFIGASVFGYNTLKSSHFYLHYPKELKLEKAKNILYWAEGAYKKLKPIFDYDVSPVHIQVHNKVDMANGNALTVMFNKINVYITSPGYDDEIGFKNWMQSLLIHELTHVFELDARAGYSSVLRFIFGKPPVPFTSPNYTLPFWLHEGMAVLNESLYAPGGRLNSTDYNAIYRKSVIYNNFPHISRLSYYTNNPEHPYGSSIYIFGAAIFDSIFKENKSQQNPSGKLSKIHASRFYYFTNGGLETYLEEEGLAGKSYTDIYTQFILKEKQTQLKKLALIRKVPVSSSYLVLPKQENSISSLAIHPSGDFLYYIEKNTTGKSGLYELDMKTGKKTRLLKHSAFDSRISTGSLGRYIYFNVYRQNNSELRTIPVQYDLRTNDYEKLPVEGFTSISPSPAEDKLVGILKDEQGEKHLTVLIRSSMRKVILLKNTQVISPFFVDEKNVIALDYKRNLNKTEFIKINIETREKENVFEVEGKAINPYFNGKEILFSSDQNGVYNLYGFQLNNPRLEILSNLETAGKYPVGNKKKLFFLWLTQHGYTLAALNQVKPIERLEKISVKRLDNSSYSQANDINIEDLGDYNGFRYLNLYWWLPYISVYDDKSYWGLQSSWADPLYNHFIYLAANYDYKAKDPQYIASYSYLDDSGFSANVAAYKYLEIYGNNPKKDGSRTDYLQQTFWNQLYLGYSRVTLDYSLSILAGWVHQHWKSMESQNDFLFTQFTGDFYGPSAMLVFSNQNAYLKSIRPETGVYASIAYHHFLEPKMQEIKVNTAFSLGGVIFENGVISANNEFGGVFGSRLPQYYYSIGGLAALPTHNSATLRGYDAGVLKGYYYLLGSIEYSFPILETFKGWSTSGFFLKSLYLTGFYDYGQTTQTGISEFQSDSFYVSYGAELGFSMMLGHALPLDLIAGAAYAYNTDETRYYFSIKLPFGTPSANMHQQAKRKFSIPRSSY